MTSPTLAGGCAAVLCLALPAAAQTGALWLPGDPQPSLVVTVEALAAGPDGSVYVGSGTGGGARGVRWVPDPTGQTGGTWDPLGEGVNSTIRALAVAPDGTIHAGGGFWMAGGQSANYLARWASDAEGTWQWHAFVQTPNQPVNALAVAADGTLYVGGSFTLVGGTPASFVARWTPDGAAGTWSALGAGANLTVNALALAPDGTLYVGGDFSTAGGNTASRVARWTPDGQGGGTWGALGSGILGTSVVSLAIGPDGELYAGGFFSQAGDAPAASVARWTPDGAGGGTWSALGAGVAGWVRALAVGASGEVYAGGEFAAAGGAGGPSYIALWTPDGQGGGAWSGLGAGVNGGVYTLASQPGGTLYVGGAFTEAGGTPARYFARWGTVPVGGAPGPSDPEWSLGAPSPNPARGAVSLRLGRASMEPLRVTVHDVLGRTVAVLADGPQHADAVVWDASAVPAGVYTVRAERAGAVAWRRVTVAR